MTVKAKERCAWQTDAGTPCNSPAPYRIGRGAWWGLVCAKHDRLLGIANLQDAFRLQQYEAIAMNARIVKLGRW